MISKVYRKSISLSNRAFQGGGRQSFASAIIHALPLPQRHEVYSIFSHRLHGFPQIFIYAC